MQAAGSGAVNHVTVNVNGRNHRMSCAPGSEARVTELAAMVEAHVAKLRAGRATVQDEKLYLMAAITLADELRQAQDKLAAEVSPRVFQAEIARLEPRPNGPIRRIAPNEA